MRVCAVHGHARDACTFDLSATEFRRFAPGGDEGDGSDVSDEGQIPDSDLTSITVITYITSIT
jgi:hypothetical protein